MLNSFPKYIGPRYIPTFGRQMFRSSGRFGHSKNNVDMFFCSIRVHIVTSDMLTEPLSGDMNHNMQDKPSIAVKLVTNHSI